MKGGADDDSSVDDDPQQGQRGQGGGRGAAAGGGRGPRNRTLHFEYDMATAKVTLIEDYKKRNGQPRWASMSPDEQNDHLRAQPQPLHDGRGELREGAEERRTTRRSPRRS